MKLNLVVAAVVASLVVCAAQERRRDGDWPLYGRDAGAQRFSPLTQITRQNVGTLQQAWTFDTGAKDLQVTPIVVDGVMYLTGGTRVFALEPETGRPIWTYEAEGPVSRRGVAYWRGNGRVAPRVFVGAGDGRMVALHAKTGEVETAFGERGFLDLKSGVRGDVDGRFMLISPPAVYRDIVITGGSNGENEPSTGLYGDIRGWDAITGKLRWTFHTVPREGEPGVDSWEGDCWRNRSGTNAWSYLTLDEERGLVFAPTGFTRLMHQEGEPSVARVAGRMGIPYALSTLGTSSPEDVAAARGR